MRKAETEIFISKYMPLLFYGVQPARATGLLSNVGSAGSKEVQMSSCSPGFALQKPVEDMTLKEIMVEQY